MVRAIIIAAESCGPALHERYAACLLPLLDRPFIQQVVERLIELGATECDFILHHLPADIERLLGDGTRWGCKFRFHLARDPLRPLARLKHIVAATDAAELCWLAYADCLPVFDATPPNALAPEVDAVTACAWRGPEASWTGWARLPAQLLTELPPESDRTGAGAWLMSRLPTAEVRQVLRADNLENLLAAQSAVWQTDLAALTWRGPKASDGILLGRNVVLHPTAQVLAPSYVGANCRLESGVQVGPHAVISRDCVLDTGCQVSDALILPGSYIGPAVAVSEAVVDRNLLANARLGASLEIAEDFILGSLRDKKGGGMLGRLFSQLIGTVLLLLSLPVLLLTVLWLKVTRRGAVWHAQEVVRLPSSASALRTFRRWSLAATDAAQQGAGSLLLHFVPGLINVARGELCLVGVAPRTPDELEALPADWRALYLQAKAGLITEAEVTFGPRPTADELYTAEAVYAVTHGAAHDARLLWGYFLRCFWPPTREVGESV